MAKTHHWGALSAAVGTLVAGGLLLLMLLVVVEPAGAAFPGQNGKIAYTGGVPGSGNPEIFTINPDRSGERQLTKNYPFADENPAWSPGRNTPIPGDNLIAFASNRDGDDEIYTMDPTLGTQIGGMIFTPTDRLTNNTASDDEPAWSPDGHMIAFTRNGPGASDRDVYITVPTGQIVVPLTNNDDAPDFGPAWSPDGKQIAFTRSYGSGNLSTLADIYTMNSDGTAVSLVTTKPGLNYHDPDWQPLGHEPGVLPRQLQP